MAKEYNIDHMGALLRYYLRDELTSGLCEIYYAYLSSEAAAKKLSHILGDDNQNGWDKYHYTTFCFGVRSPIKILLIAEMDARTGDSLWSALIQHDNPIYDDEKSSVLILPKNTDYDMWLMSPWSRSHDIWLSPGDKPMTTADSGAWVLQHCIQIVKGSDRGSLCQERKEVDDIAAIKAEQETQLPKAMVMARGLTRKKVGEYRFAQPTVRGGRGPDGYLEVSEWCRSIATFSGLPTSSTYDFVYSHKDNVIGLLTMRLPEAGAGSGGGRRQTVKMLGHDGIREEESISTEGLCGGRLRRLGREGDTVIIGSNEWSGHYGENWTDTIRCDFIELCESLGIKVFHKVYAVGQGNNDVGDDSLAESQAEMVERVMQACPPVGIFFRAKLTGDVYGAIDMYNRESEREYRIKYAHVLRHVPSDADDYDHLKSVDSDIGRTSMLGGQYGATSPELTNTFMAMRISPLLEHAHLLIAIAERLLSRDDPDHKEMMSGMRRETDLDEKMRDAYVLQKGAHETCMEIYSYFANHHEDQKLLHQDEYYYIRHLTFVVSLHYGLYGMNRSDLAAYFYKAAKALGCVGDFALCMELSEICLSELEPTPAMQAELDADLLKLVPYRRRMHVVPIEEEWELARDDLVTVLQNVRFHVVPVVDASHAGDRAYDASSEGSDASDEEVYPAAGAGEPRAARRVVPQSSPVTVEDADHAVTPGGSLARRDGVSPGASVPGAAAAAGAFSAPRRGAAGAPGEPAPAGHSGGSNTYGGLRRGFLL